jgi:hypothetical protein
MRNGAAQKALPLFQIHAVKPAQETANINRILTILPFAEVAHNRVIFRAFRKSILDGAI